MVPLNKGSVFSINRTIADLLVTFIITEKVEKVNSINIKCIFAPNRRIGRRDRNREVGRGKYDTLKNTGEDLPSPVFALENIFLPSAVHTQIAAVLFSKMDGIFILTAPGEQVDFDRFTESLF